MRACHLNDGLCGALLVRPLDKTRQHSHNSCRVGILQLITFSLSLSHGKKGGPGATELGEGWGDGR